MRCQTLHEKAAGSNTKSSAVALSATCHDKAVMPYLFGSASRNLKEHCPAWASFVALTATAKSPCVPEQTMPPVAALNQTASVTTSFLTSAHAQDIIWLHERATH